MRTTIDKAGRIVVPKKLRERLGLVPGTELVIEQDDEGGLRLERADPLPRAEIVERDGRLVVVGDGSWKLTVESVREMVEELRDRRH